MESSTALSLVSRKSGALLGMLAGDALAMPVHWFYDIKNIKAQYGAIQGYT